jgi:hypothetical protein
MQIKPVKDRVLTIKRSVCSGPAIYPVFNRRLFFFDASINSMLISRSAPRKKGNIEKSNAEARLPNIIGMMVDAKDALAICIPMIDCEYSLPKLRGVSCNMLGKMGAQPSPNTIKPVVMEAL